MRIRRWASVAAPALVGMLALSECASRQNPGGSPTPVRAPSAATPTAPGLPSGVDLDVERVVDGDTIVVTAKRRVRLIGIDTPETQDPRRPVGCFGKEASAFTTSLLPKGSKVRLVGDVDQQDAFGRTLAYVYRLTDGVFVNAELLRRGYANVLTVPPNVAHAEEFVALARLARESSAGLWGACGSESVR